MRASYASAIAISLGALFVVPHAFAHHSFAPHFDSSKPVNISGTITEFEARNPHSYLHIAATDENGRTREYVCESHGVTQLSRNGIKADMLKAGTKVRVTGSLSRHSAYMCFFDNVEFADGRTLNVNGPRSSLGHSIGHMEGDTLVIETANYSAGVLNQYVEQPGQPTKGLLHSAALTSVERLSLDATRQRLVVEIDLADPEFFKQPFPRSRNEYAASALKIEPFNCSPEGVTGTIKK
jgi:hypothetical protein